jgi:hypothetical protein
MATISVGLGGWPPQFEPAVAVHSSVETVPVQSSVLGLTMA